MSALLVALCGGPLWAPVQAQPAAASPPSSAAASAAAVGTAFDVVTAAPVELGAPDSPRASLAHYFEAVRTGRWDLATRYLVLEASQRPRGPELARRLKAVIDDTGWIDLETVSDSHAGHVGDGLPSHLEEVARFTVDGRNEALRMVRRSDDQGAHWAFSAATVARIDAWYGTLPDRWLRELFVSSGFEFMLLPGPLELLWWQWFALVALLLLAWLVGSLLGRATRWLLRQVAARTPSLWDDEFVASIAGPLSLAWGLMVLLVGSRHLLLLRPAARLIDGLTTAGIVFALFWALWRGTGVGARQMLDRPWARDSASARTLISVGGNLARGAIVFGGILAVLSALGYPIGTLLAGLGIGGLALAFGAQKTIENLFGSVSIAVDQPFRVGDLVSVDSVTGVIENIGLRSTRLRTADRTLISMPNGKLADLRIESYAARDRFRFTTTIGLTYGATPEQILEVCAGVERVFREHPRVWQEVVDVHFAGLGESTLDITVLAWFEVPSWAEFVDCREEALLAIVRVVQQAGADFAFPTRTVHLVSAALR
ncbi:mechanosensitive ion channel family protein [uncultured Piscinibacter sp.]|uniref:mechanosensitive ion channel family protein n=1 Tax=uncultured Piscinibacter sp. TaxID=1131835 RepID=UPI0026255F1E|nr:mechanosensitive ion channel family protein [uncultured Piscinibacter sp.]